MAASWKQLQSGLASLNLGQSANKLAKGFNSSVQATRERLGQVAAEDITELPQGEPNPLCTNGETDESIRLEYKDLEARVDALRQAHLTLLKCVWPPSFVKTQSPFVHALSSRP